MRLSDSSSASSLASSCISLAILANSSSSGIAPVDCIACIISCANLPSSPCVISSGNSGSGVASIDQGLSLPVPNKVSRSQLVAARHLTDVSCINKSDPPCAFISA